MDRLVVIVTGTNDELCRHKRPFASNELVYNTDTCEFRRGPGMWQQLQPWTRLNQAHHQVAAASLANVTIATALNAGDTLSGVTLVAGYQVLLMGQTDATENGIYTVAASPARTPEFTEMDDLAGKIIEVTGGTYASKLYRNTNIGGTIGSQAVTFVPFNPEYLQLDSIGALTRVPSITTVLDTDVILLQRADGSLGRCTAAALKTYVTA